MKTLKPLLIILLLLQSMPGLFSQAVSWEMHYGQGAGQYVPPPGAPSVEDILKELVGNVQHGDSGGFKFAEIPPEDDADWVPAPLDPEDGQLCFRLDRSALTGTFTALDFTYFQATITVSDPSQPFIISFNEVDDGVRAYVFNDANPEGGFIEGGDARLYFTPKAVDLSPLFVQGENRIVLVQFDDSHTENYLKTVVTYTDDECGNDTEAPSLEGCPEALTVTLDLCNEYELSLDSLGITALDNCTDSVALALSQSVIAGAGTSTITVTATDDAGNTSSCDISVTTETNPEFISVTAEDDSFSTTPGQGITISAATLLANDAASDGSALEVQDLMLVNPEDGELTDNGDGTYTFIPAPEFVGTVQLTYLAKSEDESLFFEGTGNFYEFIASTGISWDEAKAEAESRSLNGVSGYLATVTSQAENDFIQTKLQGTGWMGASDAEEEGVWKWVTGPEAGTEFWLGDGSGTVAEGFYANWDPNAGSTFPAEPNNDIVPAFNPEGENYGHFRTDGLWNDWPNTVPALFGVIQGFVVEYGGVGGCTPVFTDEATVSIEVEAPACSLAISGFSGGSGVCPGTYSTVINTTGADDEELEFSIDGVSFQSSNAFSEMFPGSYTVIVRKVNDISCADSLSLEVSNPDTEAPQIFNELADGSLILMSEYLQESYDCGETPDVNPVIVDNCDPNPSLAPSVTVSPQFDENGNIITTVTLDYTVSDVSGNENQEIFTYTYTEADTEAPQIFNELADGSLILMSEYLQESYDCGETPDVDPVIVDNCDPEPSLAPSVTVSPQFDENGNIITTVTLDYTVSDVSGNENQEIFTYTYTDGDIEAPTIQECVSSEDLYVVEIDSTYNVIGGEEAILLDLNAVDNCSELDGLSLNYTINQVEIDEAPSDSVTISATIFLVDEAGNVSDESCEVRLRAANPDNIGEPFAPQDEEVEAMEVKISPNPFNAQAKVRIKLRESSTVRIEIRNLSGHLMETLLFDEVAAGQEQEFNIQRDNLPNGIYMITAISAETYQTIRAVITR